MRDNIPKLIAMFLPQFHVIPENDLWWGKGFTEWTNTKKATPLYKGHDQPKTPMEEDYYDLLDPSVLKRQANQANEYGIDGFAFYHYWFDNGKKMLYRPAEILHENKDININYCFAWANEDWTRTWYYGREGQRELLIKEEYGWEEDWKQHFDYFLPFFSDQRYIKVDNKPVLLIYQMADIENKAPNMLSYWNQLAKKNGFEGIYWIAFDQHRTKQSKQFLAGIPEVNATADFVPGRVRDEVRNAKDWNRTIKNIVRRILPDRLRLPKWCYDLINYDEYHKRILGEQHGEKQFWNCLVDYDDSPRRGKNAIIMDETTPEKFGMYLHEYIQRSIDENKEFVFVTAWNEWGEGNHLEPDEKYGYRWLEAVREAKRDLIYE